MALNIKNPEVERLAAEVAGMKGESKTEAIRIALRERKERLSMRIGKKDRGADLLAFLDREVWPVVPADQLGRSQSKAELEGLLGFGPAGV
jgi:antitoxin VapB